MTEPTVDVTVTLPVDEVRRRQQVAPSSGSRSADWYRQRATEDAAIEGAWSTYFAFMAALIETPLPEPVREVVVGCVARRFGGPECKVLFIDGAWAAVVNLRTAARLWYLLSDLTFVRDGKEGE